MSGIFFANAGSLYVDRNAQLIKLIELFKERASWQFARKILVTHRVPVGIGWENTIEAVKSQTHVADVAGLVQAYLEHISYGEKSVRLYRIGSAQINKLRQHFRSFQKPTNLPLPLSGNSLKKAHFSDPTLAYVFEDKSGLTGIYSSIRKRDERTRVDVAKLPQAVRSAFADFEEVIGVHSRKVQSFDVVWLPAKGDAVEVRADFLSSDIQETVIGAHQKVYAAIHKASGSKALISPVDLFSAIKPMYDNGNEGNVIELAFVTSTGSTKNETMRDKALSLRQEVYHVNGKAALSTEIEPYRIGLRWSLVDRRGDVFTPELYLEGRATMAAAASPGLFSATIRKCKDEEEYAVMRYKLQSYL